MSFLPFLPLITLIVISALFSLRGARGQDISVVYTLDEELPAGTYVGNIAQDSNIRDLVGSEQEFRALTYSFLAEGSNFASNFLLQNNSGILSTTRVLDREALCSFRSECRLPLRLAAQSSQSLFFRIIDVSVMVNDVNDNAPFFQPPVVNLSILENADVGDLFQLPTAVDADAGVNHSVRNYSLLTSGVPFGLHTEGGVAAGGAGLWLQLKGSLDREAVSSYQLLLVAVDGGQPVRSGTLTVHVEVKDVNDHAPVWDRGYYAANVSEIEAVGSAVLTLKAHDEDIGDNAVVSYRFSPQQADIALGLFALNQTSGQITVAKPLDSYAGQTYTLEVEARDSGTPFKTSRTDVIVHVMDTHNSRPDMILSVFGQGNVAELSEFSELGRVVAHIAVSDPDSGLNGIVLCQSNSSYFELQAMDVRQYKVILSQPLDRELQDAHEVNVTCQDAGSPPLYVIKTFTVQVRDENDQYPVFSPAFYEARITESAAGSRARDVYVTSVSASDGDVGENARISYRVIEDPGREFRMLENGTLLAVRGLDREAGDNPRRILVVAHDHGAIENSATATVILTILDVNDNPPIFTDLYPVFHVSEGAPVGSYVGNVTATDRDVGNNAVVSFRLRPEDEGWLPFRVLPEGRIQTSESLDREEVDRYEFTLVATDRGRPPLSSTVTATVVVTDINDNSPIFLFPSPLNNTLRLPHTLRPHTAVTSLLAYDADWGYNAELQYSREGTNGTVYFDVVPATGEVILVRPLTKQQLGEHVLTVAVHDLGTPVQLANQTLLYVYVYEANQTKMALSKEEESFRNTLMVVGIVTVTALLSLVVAVAIVMMKRKDRQKHLYRAKEAEYKVDDHLRQLASKQPWSHELQVCPVPSELTVATAEQRRRKEVSFSLDEDNNIASGSSPMAPDPGTDADSLETMQEVTHSQKRLLGPRGPEDDVSDASCDVSTSDSGRGGSDVEMHSQQGAPRESADGSFASHHRGPSRGMDSRRHLHPSPRSVTFDPYPLTFSSGRLTTFPTSRLNDDVSQTSRQPMTTFSSFSPLPRQVIPARASPSSSASSLPPSRSLSRVAPCPQGPLGEGEEKGRSRPSSVSSPIAPLASASETRSPRSPNGGLHLRSPQTKASQSAAAVRPPSLSPRTLPSVSPPRPPSQGESYIDLHRQRRYEGDTVDAGTWPSSSMGGSYVHLKEAGSARQGDGDYVDMGASGAASTYVPSSQISAATTSTGTCDGETTLSGSYTLDPQELVQEIDQLFFEPPGDVVV